MLVKREKGGGGGKQGELTNRLALDDLTKDNMLPIKMGRRSHGDKEL